MLFVDPTGVSNSYQELLGPSSYDRKWYLSQLFCHKIPRGVLSNQRGQYFVHTRFSVWIV